MPSNEALLDELGREKDRRKSLRVRTERKLEQATELGGVIAGGAIGGAIDGKWGTKKLGPFGVNAALGALGLIFGLLELAGKMIGAVAFTGAGMWAWEAGKFTFGRMKATQGAQPAVLGHVGAPAQLGQAQQYTTEQMRERLRALAA